MTFTFDPWKTGEVASTTIELPVHTSGAEFLGEWRNVDDNSRGPSRLKIAKAEKGWTIQAWDNRGSQEADHGKVKLSLLGDSVYSTVMRYGLANWSDDTNEEHVTLRREQDRLLFEQFVIFKNEPNAANYRTLYEFKRAETAKENP